MNLTLPDAGGEFVAGAQAVEIEDRAAPRFTLLIRPAKLHVGRSQFVCIIRDISATGVSVRLFHDVAWKGPIVLELQTGDRYAIEMVWNKGTEAGLQFLDPIDVDNVIGHCSLYPKRDLRFDIRLPIAFQSCGQAYRGELANLSRQGALLESDAMLAIDQAIMIEAADLPMIEARVRWRRENRFGLVFDTTFSLAELAKLVQQLQSAERDASAGAQASGDGAAAS